MKVIQHAEAEACRLTWKELREKLLQFRALMDAPEIRIPPPPPRFRGWFFQSFDLCVGWATPFRLFKTRRLVKKGAKYGITIVRMAWMTFSMRW